MQRHIIVSGDDALATTIADELKNAGAMVRRMSNADTSEAGVARELTLADVSHAIAVVCAGDDDAVNLEIALLARKANPNVRVVSRVANDVLREAIANDNGPGAILDVAELAAPAVVEACLSQATHDFDAAGHEVPRLGQDRIARGARCASSTATWRRWRSSTAKTPPTPVRWRFAPAATAACMPATGR